MCCVPCSKQVDIDQFAQFVVIATSGVWEVLTIDDASEICNQVRLFLFVLKLLKKLALFDAAFIFVGVVRLGF